MSRNLRLIVPLVLLFTVGAGLFLRLTFSSKETNTMTKPAAGTTEHATFTPYIVQASDRTTLSAYEWKPLEGDVKATVVIVHGIRDHATRYEALADNLAANGIAVYAQDHRGHGYSDGKRQYFDSVGQLVSDVHLAVSEAQTRHPGVPVFLYGHSLGGLVATHYSLAYPDELAGVILSGPALKLFPTVSGVQQGLARFFSVVAPGLPAQPVDDTEFVRDEKAKADLASDPVIDHSNLPARSAAAGLNGIEEIQRRMGEVKVPLLIMHGTEDKATNIEGSRELNDQASSNDKTLKLYDGLFHDLLHEPEHETVIGDVTAWILARL